MIVGYAAFLDVLGFSALISGDQGKRVEKYLQCLKDVFTDAGANPVNYAVFSDSIILTTADDDPASLRVLLERCSTLFGAMLAREIALRGAIAHGPYITEQTGNGTFVAGRAIIDAYHFESAQDWIGVMLAPSVIARVPDLPGRCEYQDPLTPEIWLALKERLPWAAFVQPCNTIPFREGGHYQGFAIVPSNGNGEPVALRDSLKTTLEHLAWLKSLAPDPQAQAKYDRTRSWLDAVHRNWYTAEVRRAQQNL